MDANSNVAGHHLNSWGTEKNKTVQIENEPINKNLVKGDDASCLLMHLKSSFFGFCDFVLFFWHSSCSVCSSQLVSAQGARVAGVSSE